MADNERVIADHRFTGKRNIGLRGSGLLVLNCVADQKPVERFAPAVEGFNRVPTLQFFDPKRRNHSGPLRSNTLGLLEEFRKAWRGLRRRIERRLKLRPLFGVEPEPLTIRQRLFGSGESAFENEITDGPARHGGGYLKGALRRRCQAKIKLLVAGFGLPHDLVLLFRIHGSTLARHCHDTTPRWQRFAAECLDLSEQRWW